MFSKSCVALLVFALLFTGCAKTKKDSDSAEKANKEALNKILNMKDGSSGDKRADPIIPDSLRSYSADDCIEICQNVFTVADSKCLGNCPVAFETCGEDGDKTVVHDCVVEILRMKAEHNDGYDGEDVSAEDEDAIIDVVRNGYARIVGWDGEGRTPWPLILILMVVMGVLYFIL